MSVILRGRKQIEALAEFVGNQNAVVSNVPLRRFTEMGQILVARDDGMRVEIGRDGAVYDIDFPVRSAFYENQG
jgi:hypothetical protein